MTTSNRLATVLARLEAMNVAELEYSSTTELTKSCISNYLFNINSPSTLTKPNKHMARTSTKSLVAA